MAGLLALGMTQCKKEQNNQDEGEKYAITLRLDGGAKVGIQPNDSGEVHYESGDQMVVAYDGKYVGTLNYDHGAFSNNLVITKSDTDQPLYFYFLGNRQGTLEANATTCTVDISDQTDSYAVLSYAASNEIFVGSGTYTAKLLNQSGLVKFITPSGINDDIAQGIAVTGMNNQVTVDFAQNTFTPEKVGDGHIYLKKETDTERWAVLPVQSAVTDATAIADGYYESATFRVPRVVTNAYLTDGIEVPDMPEKPYTINGRFTVGSSTIGEGTVVHFSRGNLQYLGARMHIINPVKFREVLFRFANNQYDYMGNGANGNVRIAGWGTYNDGRPGAFPPFGSRDLFGWGTSGYNGVEPYTIVQDNSSYAYPGSNTSIAGTDYDWGVYNKATNYNKFVAGGNYDWRTLTATEWSNLLNREKKIQGNTVKLWAYANVMGVNGLLLFPDEWDGQVNGSPVNINYAGTSYADNVFLERIMWRTLEEEAGVVFLPAAGYRNPTEVQNAGTYGYYWSTTAYQSSQADYLYISPSNNNYSVSHVHDRYMGHSVRLVFDATSNSK